MSYTNGTTHYNLPLTTGSDKRDWSDTNQAFADVDSALYGAVQDTAQAKLDIDALETRMDTAEQNISTNTGNIAGLDTRLTTAEGAITSMSSQITDTRRDLEDMICAYNEASATSTHAYSIGDYFIYNDVLYRAIQAIAIGDTIVPDTNCTTTNATSELIQIIADQPDPSEITQIESDISTLQTDVNNLSTAEYSQIFVGTNTGGNVASALRPVIEYIIDNDLNNAGIINNFIIVHSGWTYNFTEFGTRVSCFSMEGQSNNAGISIRFMSINSSDKATYAARTCSLGATYGSGSLSDVTNTDDAVLYVRKGVNI